jgi:predicted amidohydrolase YtcJ
MMTKLPLLAALSGLIFCSALAQTADTIYHGGPIVTVNDAAPSAEALAVKDGKILAIGKKDNVLKTKGDGTKVVDLGGKTLAPGFIDGHAHLFQFGTQAVGANLLAPPDGTVNTVDDVVAKLKEFATGPDVSNTGWVFGVGYDDALLGRHPTAEDLDKVSTELPVIAVHISGHFSALNTVGLKKVGYSATTKDPEGGIIRRKPGTQEPNGVLEELASFPAMIKAVTPTTPEGKAYFMKRGVEMAKRFGYTTAHEGRAFPDMHEAMGSFAKSGGYDIDVVSYMDYTDLQPLESEWYGPTYKNHYRIAGVKITLDGSPQGRTAWRTQPYLLPPDGQKPGYKGYPAIPNDIVVKRVFERAYENKWQVIAHANGDAAVDQLIRAVRPVHEKYGPGDRRHVLIHGQFVRMDQLDALKELQMIPSLFPMHTFYWGDWYDKIIGPELAQQISPLKSAIKIGMIVTSHTDAPVALPNLMQVMSATVNRTSRSGKVMGPDERLTPLEALKCFTLWGAYQHFEEKTKGSLEVGKLADMVILSDNPLTCEPSAIGKIAVLGTIKEGRKVFTASAR